MNEQMRLLRNVWAEDEEEEEEWDCREALEAEAMMSTSIRCLNLGFMTSRLMSFASNSLSAMFMLPFLWFITPYAKRDMNKLTQQTQVKGSQFEEECIGYDWNPEGGEGQIVFIFFLMLVVMMVHVFTAFGSTTNRIRCHFFLYFTIIGLWLLLLIMAHFSDSWGESLELLLNTLQVITTRFRDHVRVSFWELDVLRLAIIVDMMTYPLMMVFAVLSFGL
jgi:hypothetical protein